MTDIRSEIPALAYVNAQIIQEAVRVGALDQPTRQVEMDYRLPTGCLRILNPGYLLGLLYCLFVVPKEFWIGREESHPAFTDIDSDKLLPFFSISKKSEKSDKNPRYHLLRHIRNSISHVRFGLDDDVFILRDVDRDKETFRATCTLAVLSEFVSYVGPVLANLRNMSLRTH